MYNAFITLYILCYTIFLFPNIDMESNSYSYSEDYLDDLDDNNSPKEDIPELIFLPDNPIINTLLEIEREESSKLSVEQWDNNLWQNCVNNMFRIILEKQINKLLEYNLPKDIMEQVLVLKEEFKREVCVRDLEEQLYNICKQICFPTVY